jgi:hypothetical protein
MWKYVCLEYSLLRAKVCVVVDGMHVCMYVRMEVCMTIIQLVACKSVCGCFNVCNDVSMHE